MISKLIPLSFSSNIVETLAIARAISEIVIKTLISNDDSFSPFGNILVATKATVETNYCISFSHVRRFGNFIAHNLAKYARHVRGFLVWMEDVPPHLQCVLFSRSWLIFLNEFMMFKKKKKKKKAITNLNHNFSNKECNAML